MYFAFFYLFFTGRRSKRGGGWRRPPGAATIAGHRFPSPYRGLRKARQHFCLLHARTYQVGQQDSFLSRGHEGRGWCRPRRRYGERERGAYAAGFYCGGEGIILFESVCKRSADQPLLLFRRDGKMPTTLTNNAFFFFLTQDGTSPPRLYDHSPFFLLFFQHITLFLRWKNGQRNSSQDTYYI